MIFRGHWIGKVIFFFGNALTSAFFGYWFGALFPPPPGLLLELEQIVQSAVAETVNPKALETPEETNSSQTVAPKPPDETTELVSIAGSEQPATLYTRFCEEDQPDSGELGVLVLSDEYSWVYGSETRVHLVGEPVVFPEVVLQSDGVTSLLDRAQEIVAVGTASCEGNPTREIERAYDRGIALRGWVNTSWRRNASPGDARDLHVLNLGRYVGACPRDDGARSHHQRRVILIAITRTPEVDLERCLCEVFRRTPDLAHLVDEYSSFALNTSMPEHQDSPCDR